MLNYSTTSEYFSVFIFLGISLVLSAIIMILPQIFAYKKDNKDKLKGYECGFEPFDEARSKFDIRFYLIAMLFIIFDLEIAFLIPWALNLSKIGIFGFYSMMFFLVVLIVGFIYEWKKGALEWE